LKVTTGDGLAAIIPSILIALWPGAAHTALPAAALQAKAQR
jgi:type III secretory pathway component EscV